MARFDVAQLASDLLQKIANLAPGVSQSIRRQASGSEWEVFTPMQSDVGNLSPSINVQSGTTYTLLATDRGRPILFTANSPVALTLPNSFPQG